MKKIEKIMLVCGIASNVIGGGLLFAFVIFYVGDWIVRLDEASKNNEITVPFVQKIVEEANYQTGILFEYGMFLYSFGLIVMVIALILKVISKLKQKS